MTTDVLTRRDIARSMAEDPTTALLAISPRAIDEHAAYVRRSLEREDYATAVALEQIPAWERALAMVVCSVEVLGAVHEGRFPPEPVPTFTRGAYVEPDASDDAVIDPFEAYRQALAAEELGYEHNPGWSNGGISAHGAVLETDAERERQDLPPYPNVSGVTAYNLVHQIGGLPELAWYYSASAFELGLSSIQEGFMAQMLLGYSAAEVSVVAFGDGPTTFEIVAASRHRSVRRRLGRIPVHSQADLELSYTDRIYDAQLVATYGEGLAPLVWRAARRAGEVSKDGQAYPSNGTLRELVADARRDWPTYEAPIAGTMKDRIRKVVDLVLWTAHERYRAAAGLAPSPTRKRRARKAKADTPILSAAGKSGRKRRQLVEVPRRAA